MSIDQQSNQCTHEHTKRLDFINFHVIFIRNKLNLKNYVYKL